MARALLVLSSAFVADAIRWGQHGQGLDPACKCLDFAAVYESGKAQCGMGLELVRVATKPEMMFPGAKEYAKKCLPKIQSATNMASLWQAMNRGGPCTWEQLTGMDVEDCGSFPGIPNSSFYQHQRHSYCMKASNYAEPGSFLHKASWCYVSAQCRSLNGGARINNAVSWKACQEDQDKFLGELAVPDLCKLEDMLHPAGKTYGGCQMAAFKAYPLSSWGWESSLARQAFALKKAAKQPTRYWKEEKKDAAVVQQHGRRYEIYGDFRDGSDYKCVSGCA